MAKGTVLSFSPEMINSGQVATDLTDLDAALIASRSSSGSKSMASSPAGRHNGADRSVNGRHGELGGPGVRGGACDSGAVHAVAR